MAADESSSPHFIRSLIPGFLTDFCIPTPFLKHLSLSESESRNNFVAVLKNSRFADKSWSVKVDRDGRRFMDGWKEFAQQNCLRVGDFVVFRYLGGFVFDVLVCDSLTGCVQSCSADCLIQPESDRSEINYQTPASEHILSQISGDEERSGHSETSNQITEIDQRQEQLNSHSEGSVLSNEKCNLQAEKNYFAEEKREFKPSTYPYFRTSVKQYSFTWHATLIPTDFARKNNLAKRWCEMTIIDQKNRSWPINLRYRKVGKDQVYLASGWDKLRDAHELKVGDSMVFELIDSGSDPVMKFYSMNFKESFNCFEHQPIELS